MSDESPKEQLFRRTLAAREEPADRRPADRRPADRRPPAPGDLFVFPETARFSVEWAVLEEDSDPERRLLVTPADLHPLAASSDVSVAPGSVSGSVTLRCGLAVWISESAFDVERRTGRLAPEDLERARSKRAQVAARSLTGSVSERETEAEPEYQDLKQELAQAQAALLTAPRHRAIIAARGPMHGEPGSRLPATPFRPPPTWQSAGSFYGLAASMLLVSTLALGGALTWQHRQLSSLERQLQASEAARINLPLAFFPAVGSVRGPAKTVTLPAAASHFLIVVDVKETFPHYRLEVGAAGATEPLWRSDGLTSIGHGELTVALPRQSFSAGEFWLRLFGLDGEQAEPLARYRMNVEVE